MMIDCIDQVATEKINGFTGPLFIIGMQRSGTKLLRELLNGHPQISIPSVETNCLPYWFKMWNDFGDLSNPANFAKFYRHVARHPYFIYTKNQTGPIISEQQWYQFCRGYTLAEVFEALIRHDANVEYDSNTIWGDKSPSYITQLPLLKQIFPKARFIHIIRDVRDYCLSLHKAWKKNMLRAAQRWADNVMQPPLDAQHFPENYLEVKYEQLLYEPEQELKRCCTFLGVPFDPKMTQLTRATENIGDAKGDRIIRTSNKEKYLEAMEPKLRRMIEAIAASAMTHFGYTVEYSGPSYQLSKSQMFYYQLLDGFNFLTSEAQREGFLTILRIELGAYITSR
jgi:hypothetical protein